MTDFTRDRTALVTGASRGLGKAMAMALGEAGLRVALVSRNGEALEETAREMAERGMTARPFAADVSDEREVAA